MEAVGQCRDGFDPLSLSLATLSFAANRCSVFYQFVETVFAQVSSLSLFSRR